MKQMADIIWTPTNATFDYSDPSVIPGGHNSLIFHAGTKYRGMPFNNSKASYEEFLSVLSGTAGNYTCTGTDTGWETFPGNSCATSVRHAW